MQFNLRRNFEFGIGKFVIKRMHFERRKLRQTATNLIPDFRDITLSHHKNQI